MKARNPFELLCISVSYSNNGIMQVHKLRSENIDEKAYDNEEQICIVFSLQLSPNAIGKPLFFGNQSKTFS